MSGSSRYEIDIIANNKASAALGKVNKQLKTIQKSTKTANGGFNKMKIAAGAAAAAFAGFKLGKAFLDTAKQFEQLGIQLKFIAGSAEAGARALGIVEKAAKRSAFSLEQMALSAPLLLTVGSVDQLNDSLGITGDIAAATGLEFDVVAGQIQRAFSGGIAAADIFKEKGIKAMLGFQEGVEYSAEETEKHIRDLWENNESVYAGAMEAMSKTWTGQVSMMGDAWLDFKKVTMESGLFPVLKAKLGDVQKLLDANKMAINDMAVALGEGLATAILGLADAIGFIAKNADAFALAAKTLVGIKLALWFRNTAVGMKLLNLAMRMNPIGLLITAIGFLVMALGVNSNGLGRTFAQAKKAVDMLGEVFTKLASYLRAGFIVVIEFVKKKFYALVDSLISAYNWLAKLIPGMERVDKTAYELAGQVKDGLGAAYDYVADKAGDAVDALVNTMDPDLVAWTKKFTQALVDEGVAYDDAVIAADKYSATLKRNAAMASAMSSYQPRNPGTTTTGDGAADAAKKALQEVQKATKEWATEWESLKEKLFPVASEIAEINKTIDTLTQKILEGGPNTELYAQAIVRLKQRLVELDPATQKLLEGLQGYEDSILRIARLEKEAGERKIELSELMRDEFEALNPLARVTREYTEDLAKLDEALAAGVISQKRHIEMTEQYGERFKKYKEGMVKDIKEIKTESEKYVESFNESFNNKLADGLVEGNLNFDTFAGLWKSTLKDLISDTLNSGTLLKDILGGFGSGGKAGGGGFNFAGLFSGGGSDGIGNFGAVGDFFGGFGSIFSGFKADGGRIPGGTFGIAGEAGPEIITGPANVLSNKESFENTGDKPQVNITIQAIDTQTGTEFLLKNRKQVEGIIQSAYNKRGKQGIY
mgnify:CR=1 FL=1